MPSREPCPLRRRALAAAAAGCAWPALDAAEPAGAGSAAALTAAQETWLRTHGPIRWLPEQDYAPFVSVDGDGRASGLSVDILDRIAQRLRLPLRQMPADPLQTQLALVRERRADLVTSLRVTPERSAYLLFTRPYVGVPTALVARRKAPGAPEPATAGLAAMAGLVVAVGSGFAVESTVRDAYPAVAWRGVPDDRQGLEGVADGRHAAAVVDAASAAHLMQSPALQGLAVSADVGFQYELCFAVRRDWPELRDIVDAGIAALPRAELAQVLRRWLAPLDSGPVLPNRAPRVSWLGAGLLAAGTLAAAGVMWRERSRRRDAAATSTVMTTRS